MGRDILQTWDRLKRPPSKTPMKSLFSSLTIQGALVALLARLFGFSLSSGETSTLLDQTQQLWPVLLGLLADARAITSRIKATRFDVPAWKSPTFWAAILSGLMTLASAFGLDLSGLQTLIEKGAAAWPQIAGLAGTVMMLYGRFRATKKLF